MRSSLRLAAIALAASALASAPFAAAQSPAELVRSKYDVDTQHSSVSFAITIIRFAKVRGRFRDYTSTIIYDPAHPERSSVTAVIKTASINTDMDFRDKHLRSPDFFNSDSFPTIVFQSDRVEKSATGLRVFGRFTMHGVTKAIELPVAVLVLPDTTPSGTVNVAFEGAIRLSRKEFGIAGTNKFNPGYNPATSLLGDSVDVTLELLANQTGYRDRSFAGRTPPSVADTVGRLVASRGVDSAIRVYRSLRTSAPSAYDFSAGQLDQLGHKLLEAGKTRDAIALLALNEEIYPSTNGVSESLGEAYAAANDREHSIVAYRRALAVDPTNSAAIEMLRRFAPSQQMTRPPVRSGHGLAFDSRRSKLVLFGGSDSLFHPLGDTWEWSGGQWVRLSIPAPEPRSGFAMSFDSRRGRVVLFGGKTAAGLVHDTWEFDGQAWTRVDTSGPAARNLSAMAFDEARGRTVLFSGSLAQGRTSDTWEWDGKRWTKASETGPAARGSHSMAYDTQQHRVVLVGGYGDDALNDSWEWDGKAWTRLTDGPSVFHSAAVFDPRSNHLLAFGGFVGDARTANLWTRAASRWTVVNDAGPTARAEHRGTYVDRVGFVIFGGIGGQGMSVEERGRSKLNDLWAYDGNHWTRLDR